MLPVIPHWCLSSTAAFDWQFLIFVAVETTGISHNMTVAQIV